MDKSWNQYCQDIGIEKRTANRWLAQFFPVQREDDRGRAVIAARVANMAVGGDGSNQHVSKSANMPNSISQPEAARLFDVSERMIRGGSKSS